MTQATYPLHLLAQPGGVDRRISLGDRPARERELLPGNYVGEYEIVRPLGRGGYGTVYLAVQRLIRKNVAIKVLDREHSSNPNGATRFIAEARAANRVGHRSIIDIFSFGELPDGRLFYVMEYLEGGTLQSMWRERGALTPDEALPILRGIADAIDTAHRAGVAHCDLKPANVFVTRDGEIRVLDFGVARLLSPDASFRANDGALIGTPYFMSPEQCRGDEVDHRTDIYSFGVMTFALLTGQLPFRGTSLPEVAAKHNLTPPPRPSELAPGLSPRLDWPILRMLAKQPDDRPSSMASAVDAIARAASASRIAATEPVPILEDTHPDSLLAPTEPVPAVSRAMLLTPAPADDPPVDEDSTPPRRAALSRVALALLVASLLAVVVATLTS